MFGEGEYGVTDVLYAAARSGDCEIFRVLYDHAISPRCWGGSVGEEVEEEEGSGGGKPSVFRWEMLNRAVHAAARGGNLKILREFLGDCSDVLGYRDGQGSTLLHAASGSGQVQVQFFIIFLLLLLLLGDSYCFGSVYIYIYAK